VAGDIFVADRGNNAVKEVMVGTGTVVTLGSGFNQPNGVAVDAAGDVYVADAGNNAIKMIPAGGGAPVVIGSGFVNPTAVALDASGNVYVCDNGNSAIKEILFDGYYAISPGLPAGLSINKISGTISGTPGVASAAANYTVTAYSAGGSGSATINITVSNPPKPNISYNSPQVYTVTTPITTLAPANTGGAVTSQTKLTVATMLNNPIGVAADAAGTHYPGIKCR